MDSTKTWLAGIRRGIALVGLLTLAYLVIFFCWLARIKLPNVPAQRLAPTLLALLWDWLAGIKWRIVPAGALLVAAMAASAGSTMGDSHISLSGSPGSMEISPGETKTYSVNLGGNPVDNDSVECGDYLSVRIAHGYFLSHLDIDRHSFGYDTDPNDDGECDDHGWDSIGNSTSVTVTGDAPGNAIMNIAYVVKNLSKKYRPKVHSSRTLVRIRVTGVVPQTPTPTPTPPPPPTPVPDPPQQPDPPPQQPDNPPQQSDNSNTPQNSGGNVPGTAPSPGGSSGGGGGGGGSGSSSRSDLACAPRPPADSAIRNLVGSTAAATAWEVAGDRLWLERKDLPNTTIELGIGWFAHDASSQVIIGLVGGNANGAMGIIRDQILGQTYTIVRHAGDDCVVRRWVAPYDHLVYQIPWETINSLYSVPVEVVSAIPLDHRHPEPNMLVRRFDGSDVRIFAFDASLQQWRHIPDYPTFQAMGFFWCDVTSADATFFERMNEGPPYPSSGTELQEDYPNCHNKKP